MINSNFVILGTFTEEFFSLEEYDTSDIVKTLISADEPCLNELVDHIQSFLIKNNANCMEQNAILMYYTGFSNESFFELQKFCTDLLSKRPEKIFESFDFISITEKSLTSLIQRDNFEMSQGQVWNYVLKWGLAQNPGLPSNPTNYSKDDFHALKNTLQQCISYIKFHSMTFKEFYDSVFPCKKFFQRNYEMVIKNFYES